MRELEEGPEAGAPREDAVPELLARHGGKLHALASRICRTPDEADDLVQEVFLAAWRDWAGFEGRSSARTWLFTIAAHACRRLHRRRAGEPETLASLESLSPFGETEFADRASCDRLSSDDVRRSDLLDRVESAIAGLPEDFRMPLVLSDVAGFEAAEVAAILDLPPGTLKSRLHRARMKIRRLVESGLERRPAPAPEYERQVCLDLLAAKQEALDRNVPFPEDGILCERCRGVFATLDLGRDLCRRIGSGGLPEGLRERILAGLA